MNRKQELDARIDKVIEAHFPGEQIPDKHIYCPGAGPLIFKEFSERLTQAEDMNNAARDDPDNTAPPVNILWENWMSIAEILFVEITKFAKKLPGFNDLVMEDRITLLKAARVEITTFMA